MKKKIEKFDDGLQIRYTRNDSWACLPTTCTVMSKVNYWTKWITLKQRCITWSTALWTITCTISNLCCSPRFLSKRIFCSGNRYGIREIYLPIIDLLHFISLLFYRGISFYFWKWAKDRYTLKKKKKRQERVISLPYYFKKLTKLLCLAFIYVLFARFMEFNIHD